jgi:4'-phosphopantetheinyl transferase
LSSSWPPGPRTPPPPSDEVHVWRVELEGHSAPAAELLPTAELLPADERQRSLRIRRPGSAARWAASRWALRMLLSRYLDEDPAAIALTSGEHGKPALAEAPERLAFNLSHSGALALVALTIGREVGVDVEAIDPARDLTALAERSLDPAVVAAVRAAPPGRRPRVFYEAWARHEALAKCLGTGIWSASTAPPPVDVSLLDLGPGHAAALAVASAGPFARRCFSLGDRY